MWSSIAAAIKARASGSPLLDHARSVARWQVCPCPYAVLLKLLINEAEEGRDQPEAVGVGGHVHGVEIIVTAVDDRKTALVQRVKIDDRNFQVAERCRIAVTSAVHLECTERNLQAH